MISNKEENKFVNGYIRGYEGAAGEQELIKLYEGLYPSMSEGNASTFLLYMWPSQDLFAFLDTLPEGIQNTTYVLNKMRSVGRSLDALNGSWHYCKELPTEILQNLLVESLSCSLDVNERIDMLALESYMEELHKPVLISEVLGVLSPKLGESYLDLTAGYGGHASEVLDLTRNYKDSQRKKL